MDDFWGFVAAAFFLWTCTRKGRDEDCPQHGDCTCSNYDDDDEL